MSNSVSTSTVFTIEIGGKVYRRPLENPYMQVSAIQIKVRQEFDIGYDFDLTYKDAILSPSDSFADLRIQSAPPLRIRRKGSCPPPVVEPEPPRVDSNAGIFPINSRPLPPTHARIDAWTLSGLRSYPFENDEPLLVLRVASLSKVYEVQIQTTATLKDLWSCINTVIGDDPSYNRTGATVPLLFNHRMHIFSDVRTENAAVEDFLALRSTFTNESSPHFFLYHFHDFEVLDLYRYQQNPTQIFTHSDWWTPRESSLQIDNISQGILLASLFTLQRYFRGPSEDDTQQRQILEAKVLNLIQEYMFPPAILALAHALQSAMFTYQKSILYDGLLKLLHEFCPHDFEEHALASFTPHLFCRLLEKCTQMENDAPPYVKYDLDEVTELLREQVLPGCNRAVDQIDFSLFMRKFKKGERNGVGIPSHIRSYTILVQRPSSWINPMDHVHQADLTQLFETMVIKYPTMVLKTRKDISRNNAADQLILLRHKQITVLIHSSQCRLSQGDARSFTAFDPFATRNHVTLKDMYYIQRDGLKMDSLHSLLQMSLRLCRVPVGPFPITVRKSLEQITLVLTDVRKNALDLYTEKNEPRTLLSSIISMLNALTEHFYAERYEYAFGLLRLDSQIEMICPITQYPYQFETAIDDVHSITSTIPTVYTKHY